MGRVGHVAVVDARVHQGPPGAQLALPGGDGRDLGGVEFVVGQVHRGLGHIRSGVGARELGAVVTRHVEQSISGGVHVSRHVTRVSCGHSAPALGAVQTRVNRCEAT